MRARDPAVALALLTKADDLTGTVRLDTAGAVGVECLGDMGGEEAWLKVLVVL